MVLAVSCSRDAQQIAPSPTVTTIFNDAATRDNNLAMGNPSGAVADATNSPTTT